jgi:hypothetical protein
MKQVCEQILHLTNCFVPSFGVLVAEKKCMIIGLMPLPYMVVGSRIISSSTCVQFCGLDINYYTWVIAEFTLESNEDNCKFMQVMVSLLRTTLDSLKQLLCFTEGTELSFNQKIENTLPYYKHVPVFAFELLRSKNDNKVLLLEGPPSFGLRVIKHCEDNSVVWTEKRILDKLKHLNICPMILENIARNIFAMSYEGELVLLSKDIDLHKWKEYIKQAFVLVKKLHALNYIHNDLKESNFVGMNNHLKLIDFGCAVIEVSDRPGGTRGYIAYESLSDECHCSFATDCWSLGIIMLNKLKYITAMDHKQLGNKKFLEKEDWTSQLQYRMFEQKELMMQAADLMKKLLAINPSERFSIDQALCHTFLL